ncbi:hypothetical protein [Cellulomonas sp.]|uniref:hypothetical protein n=1 Tax=Cellulomonas sp. TaxID=40001 RepID=UPI001B0B8084|nr:hypothetical protein [Cellulomonas sp.]MBO9553173.1 hypothetical protein [Cellulomonas sp.]
MSLQDVLVERAVPGTSELDALVAFGDELYGRLERADLDDAGAVATAAREQAPEFVALAEAAARAEDPHAAELLAVAAAALPFLRNLVFVDAADVALSSPHFRAAQGRQLAGSLAERIDETRGAEGLQAYWYLEALTRLGLTETSARFRALDVLSSITLDDAVELLERLPRLVGLAFDQWREDALEGLLYMLAEHPEARADALFELGQAQLRSALEQDSLEGILTGVAAARDQFTSAESLDEARDDATILRAALEVLTAFAQAPAQTGDEAAESLAVLSAAMNRRTAFTTRDALGGWAAPRRQAEVEWYTLAGKLRVATGPLAQVSWLTPVETLTQVLAVYQASRSLTVVSAEGLRIVLEPTVEAAFLRREGLLEHLQAALQADVLPEDERRAAEALLRGVESGGHSQGGDAMGKVLAAAPALAAELGLAGATRLADQLAKAVDESPELVTWMNEEADARRRSLARRRDPVVDDLLDRVVLSLGAAEDFRGTAREEFIELVMEVLRFAADRADVGRESGGDPVAYLFPPAAGKGAFTEDYLQRDVYSWLCSSGFRNSTRMEERDIAAGRADVSVQRVEHRFVIEVKRELSDASHAALVGSYGPQTAGYTVVGPGLSIALVLDLTSHRGGVPSLKDSVWVDEVPIQGGTARRVVTVVVRGNRPTPRQIRA